MISFELTAPGTDSALVDQGDTLVADGVTYHRAAPDIWDLTRPHRRAELDRFAAEYAAVRQAEQRDMTADEIVEEMKDAAEASSEIVSAVNRVAEAIDDILAAGLTERALILLIKGKTGMAQSDIQNVLHALTRLRDYLDD